MSPPGQPFRPDVLPGDRARSPVDTALILATTALTIIGAVSVYAATRNHLLMTHKAGSAYLQRDLVNLAVGLGLAAPALLVDYRQLRVIAPFAYAAMIGLLLLVLTPIGSTINGAHAWFSFGPVQLEPSEFSKLVVIVMLSVLLSERRDRENSPHRRDIVGALVLSAMPTLLILGEPALGIAVDRRAA